MLTLVLTYLKRLYLLWIFHIYLLQGPLFPHPPATPSLTRLQYTRNHAPIRPMGRRTTARDINRMALSVDTPGSSSAASGSVPLSLTGGRVSTVSSLASATPRVAGYAFVETPTPAQDEREDVAHRLADHARSRRRSRSSVTLPAMGFPSETHHSNGKRRKTPKLSRSARKLLRAATPRSSSVRPDSQLRASYGTTPKRRASRRSSRASSVASTSSAWDED